jgi:hypothetical protein
MQVVEQIEKLMVHIEMRLLLIKLVQQLQLIEL